MNKRTEKIFTFACAFHTLMHKFIMNKDASDTLLAVEQHPHMGNELKVLMVYVRHIVCYRKIPDWLHEHKSVINDWARRVDNMPDKDIATLATQFFGDNQKARELTYQVLMCLKRIKEISDI